METKSSFDNRLKSKIIINKSKNNKSKNNKSKNNKSKVSNKKNSKKKCPDKIEFKEKKNNI